MAKLKISVEQICLHNIYQMLQTTKNYKVNKLSKTTVVFRFNLLLVCPFGFSVLFIPSLQVLSSY